MKGKRRGAYLLPSLFTTGNILLGFYAVVLALRGRFDDAAVMIFIAGVLDALDGRIARLTGTESEFGKEYDSLADVLTFGATPAWIAYLWGLDSYGRVGWFVPLFFLLCAAIRLARFNVRTKSVDTRFFVGLPSPAAGCAVASLVLVAPASDTWSAWIDPHVLEMGMIAALVVVGALMVSTFRYPSFKKIDLRRRWSYRAALAFAAAVLVFAYLVLTYRPLTLLAAAVLYVSSGPASWVWGRLQRRSPSPEDLPPEDLPPGGTS